MSGAAGGEAGNHPEFTVCSLVNTAGGISAPSYLSRPDHDQGLETRRNSWAIHGSVVLL